MATPKYGKGSKSHAYLNTSTDITRLNTLIRGKVIFVEMAGWLHESLIKIPPGITSKLWTYHCLEGRKPGTFTIPLGRRDEMLLLESSPIEFSYVQTAVQFVCDKYKALLDVVTDGEDHKTSAGRVVGVFEGLF